MANERRTTNWPVGTELGCLSGLALAAVVTFPFFFAMAWGGAHCDPVPQCQNQNERAFIEPFAYILVASLALGLSIRSLINRVWGASTADVMAPAAKRKAKALALAITALGLLVAYFVTTRLT